MTVRSLRNYKRIPPGARPRKPGPRPLAGEELARVRERVRAELERQGWTAGEAPVQRALGDVSLWRVRRLLRELKAERRREEREARERERKSVVVRLRDAVWALDATHLGRWCRVAVQGEVLREVASGRTIGLSVGPKATAAEVVALLERIAEERGGWPLVLMLDNDGPYVSELLRERLAREGVIVLYNLPRTPQHNPYVEHGHGELKAESGLGKGVCVTPSEALLRLENARARLDEHRPRATRGWRTAAEADRETPHWDSRIDRQSFYDAATCALRRAVLDSRNARARRLAEREAILLTLVRFAAITRTRGGVPHHPSIAEGNT